MGTGEVGREARRNHPGDPERRPETGGSDLARLAESVADRYRIERELGRGGMATVYLAHDTRHGRRVAIKVLHPDLAASLGAERFLAEIRTTARLQHPHILALHDSGQAGIARHCPFFESLKGLPRFEAVAQESIRRTREFDVEAVA